MVDYVNGGVWSEKAAKEASKWARVHQPAGSLDTEAGLSYPPAEQWCVPFCFADCLTAYDMVSAPHRRYVMAAQRLQGRPNSLVSLVKNVLCRAAAT